MDNDTRYRASMQAHFAAGWGSTNFQDGTVDRLEAQRASGFEPSGSSSRMIANSSSSLSDDSDGSYPQYGVQDDYPHATSSSHGQVEGVSQNHAVAQGLDAKQEAREKKKEKDRLRKEAERAADERAYSRVCQMLAVKLDPKNTRSERSECLCIHRVGSIECYVVLKGVESIDQGFETMCELLEISMAPRKPLTHRSEFLHIYMRCFVSGIERFIVLDVIEGLVERQKRDNEVRCRFEESEARVALLEAELAQHSPSQILAPALGRNTFMPQDSGDPGAGFSGL